MTSEAEVIRDLIGEKAGARMIAGTYLEAEGLRASVSFDGGRVPAHFVTAYRPEVGESVWVLVLNGVAYVAGPTIARPGNGTIVTAAAGVATVETVIGRVTATYDTAMSFAAGALVKLLWAEGAHVVGYRVERPPPPPPPTPPAPPARTTQTITFSAIDSGSFQPGYGWRTNDVWSSTNNHSAWFYGDQIRDTIPDDATIEKAEVFHPKPDRLLLARPFGRHDHAHKPGGAIAIHDTSTLPGTEGWVEIPRGLIDHLKANPGGLGYGNGNWCVWPGKQRVDQSGALRVTFTA